jgi:hypothetical protein
MARIFSLTFNFPLSLLRKYSRLIVQMKMLLPPSLIAKASALSSVTALSFLAVAPAQAFSISLSSFSLLGNASSDASNIYLTTGAEDTSQVETFLGLTPGSIGSNFSSPTGGSAAKINLSVLAGDTFDANWFFQAGDYMPYNDFSFFSVSPTTLNTLADVSMVGDYGSGSGSFTYTFVTPGTYQVGFAVFNSLDSSFNSSLTLTGIASTAVPEPLTILGSIAAAGFVASFERKLAKSKKDEKDA